jgi:hypothetical protein
MKSAFKSAGQHGKKLSSLLVGCLLALPLAVSATQGTYISPATVGPIPPQVDATNFYNAGVWNINSSPSPYETYHTLNYTNNGTMNGSPGWEFDYGTVPNGARGWSANFFNGNGATVDAASGQVAYLNQFQTAGHLWISATNVVNQGTLITDASAEIVLYGSGMDLSRSGLEITPVTGNGGTIGITNFTPDTAIYDLKWVGGTNYLSVTGSPWNGSSVAQFTAFNPGLPCPPTPIPPWSIGPVTPQASDSYVVYLKPSILVTTNIDLVTTNLYTVYSNIVKQAVFAAVTDASTTPSVRFGPAVSPTNYFLPMAAQIIAYSTNLVTDTLQSSTVYVADDLAAVGTNGELEVNLVLNPGSLCTSPTYRPNSVVVSRTDVTGDYTGGTSELGTPPADFFYFPGIEVISNAPFLPYTISYTNAAANGRVDAYSALVDNIAAQVPPGFAPSNAPGKINIFAQNLNLSKTRMSSGSQILVIATNLVSSAGAVMDCQSLSYNLGATNGTLNFINLSIPVVQRLRGTVNEWSGLWTNYLVSIYPNWVTNSMGASNAAPVIESDITNITEVDFAITVVDGDSLVTTIPVTVQDLTLHSTNMIISDAITVSNLMLFDGSSLTISNNGGIVMAGNLQNWTTANAPKLRFFTNYGTLTIPVDAHFGDDGPTNYATFINNGNITAGSQTINSVVYQNSGIQTGTNGFYVTTVSGKVENGSINSQNQGVQFAATTLKLNNSTITSGNQLYFYVTGSLFDAGWSSGNVLTCNNGFDLAVKPPTGDLLGTALETITPVFAGVDHYWSGVDKGNSSAGYTNNEAVGQLILNEGSDSSFLFHATGASNAIYVDLLDLSKCPDFLDPDVLTIDPNFVIYYAAAKLPPSFTVPPNTNGIPQEPEEFLNGQLGGHLVWVSSFAGPNSSVDVLINGQTVSVNKALRYSKIIDSNGNGIPNYYDPNPFNPTFVLSGSMVQSNTPPVKKFAVSWTAAPDTVYQVQSSSSFISPSWTPLLNYTNSASTSVVVTVWDTNALAGQRFYRVSHP